MAQGLTDKLSYTIIRPGGLKSEAATNTGVLTEDVTVCGAINREDVASLLVKALFSAAADNKVRLATKQHMNALLCHCPTAPDLALLALRKCLLAWNIPRCNMAITGACSAGALCC